MRKKNSKLLKVTVKKQNIVTEYVCCKWTNTRDPIHVKCAVFSFMNGDSARAYSCPCVPLNVGSEVEHQPEAAPNLKQLPCRMRQNCSIRKRYSETEVAEKWLKGVAVYFATAAPAGTEMLLCLAPACLLFFQGRGEYL